MSYYVKNILDTLEDDHFHFASEEDVWQYVKANIVSTIYTLNQPLRASQCVKDSTKILTTEGFKKWNELKSRDQIITCEPGTAKMTAVQYDKLNVYPNYKGNLHIWHDDAGHTLTVTPPHRMYTKDQFEDDWEFVTSEDCLAEGKTTLPTLYAPENTLSDNRLSETQLKDLAKQISEGTLEDASVIYELTQLQAGFVLSMFMTNEQEALSLTKEQADLLQYVAIMANKRFVISPMGQAEKTQEPEKDLYMLTQVYSEATLYNPEVEEDQECAVWCPTLSTGNFVAQENGVTFVTGNSPFTNVSVYDDVFLDSLCEDYIFPDGSSPDKDIIKKLQEIYIDAMNEEMRRTPVTFPVTTACMATDQETGEILDQKFVDFIAGKNLENGFINVYMGDSSTLSSCCRLRSSTKNEKLYQNSFGGGSSKIGSLGVVTINMPRLAYLYPEEKDFLEHLDTLVEDTALINNAKRSIIKERIDQGVEPLYTLGFMEHTKQYSTTGGC